jgi:hypothetical protein
MPPRIGPRLPAPKREKFMALVAVPETITPNMYSPWLREESAVCVPIPVSTRLRTPDSDTEEAEETTNASETDPRRLAEVEFASV